MSFPEAPGGPLRETVLDSMEQMLDSMEHGPSYILMASVHDSIVPCIALKNLYKQNQLYNKHIYANLLTLKIRHLAQKISLAWSRKGFPGDQR